MQNPQTSPLIARLSACEPVRVLVVSTARKKQSRKDSVFFLVHHLKPKLNQGSVWAFCFYMAFSPSVLTAVYAAKDS
jgi:hypothetical protein